jgi:PAP2 superfamily
MLDWIAASIAFFVYVMVVAPLVRGLPPRRRLLATAASAAGIALALVAHYLPHTVLLHDWILPLVLLLLGYWSSGRLFAAPMPRAERALEALDRALDVDRAAAATPRSIAELLELAYVGVYPLIPVAFAIHQFGSAAPDPERFWTVILVTDFVCFAFLPWIQTRAPRAVRTADPWIARIRRLNLRVLGTASIQVNTFPSGHAAEALAAALLVIGAPWPCAAYVAVSAALISVGAVLGRYHYAADALAGWVVALGVWVALG